MTLSTKKSRPITIDGNSFRYQISTTKTDKDGNYRLNLTIQTAEPVSNILLVKGLITRDYWLDFPRINDHDKSEYPIITSRHIIKSITKARKHGWKYDGTDKRFELDMTNEELFK
jgi:hypothetical protein